MELGGWGMSRMDVRIGMSGGGRSVLLDKIYGRGVITWCLFRSTHVYLYLNPLPERDGYFAEEMETRAENVKRSVNVMICDT